ncbi:thioredoxin domain-containing protein [Clostridioides difficile]|nr:thioredoxin domain-containing protein [Clostridioides difficile]
MDSNRKPNNLINEKSPYLLQHAYNPINWYSWNDEAFKKAKEEDKPIFLSVGYSTCHWCHVMEKESFEDEEVAEIMNRNFVAIKVDKEERPDVDSVYMTVCQAMTGSGGWPMTIIMTPDKKPFFAGTYFPKYSRYNRPGVIDLLENVSEKWNTSRDILIKSGDEIIEALKDDFGVKNTEGDLSKEMLSSSVRVFKAIYDEKYGGFGNAPKFPSLQNLMFLMKYYSIEKDKDVLKMVEKTLDGMYRGGLFDHIGFGFSRYSTDKKWLAPHFEKMLYDNAMLTIAFLDAYKITKKELYKEIAIKTIDYVVREMKDKEGGFYSAQDADSEGEEGKFYTFNPLEIIEVLGEEDGTFFNNYFDITSSGNFEGKSIPNLIKNKEYERHNEKIADLSKKVFEYRKERTSLHKDDKILTSWNALMIVALTKAYSTLKNDIYLEYSNKCLNFINNNLVNESGRLLARYRDGSSDYLAYLDDYAFLIWAYIELYESTFNMKYLEKALNLNESCINLFWDYEKSGFYIYGKDSENLIARPKDLYDGAIPSGNSVQLYNLIRLAKITGDNRLEEMSYKQLKLYVDNVKSSPTGYSFYMLSLMFELYSTKEIICIFKEDSDLIAFKELISENFIPNATFLAKKYNEENTIIGFLNNYRLKDDKISYYVCQSNSCSQPINDLQKLKDMILGVE